MTDDQLPEREEENGLVAPVPRLVKRGFEVRLPDADQPVMAEHEPDAQEEVQRHVGHARHGKQVVVVMEINDVISMPLNLLPQQKYKLDDAETSTHYQVNGQLGFPRALMEVVYTWMRN